MNIRRTRKFEKQFAKLTPRQQQAFAKRLRLFCEDVFAEVLNNHKLHGEFADSRSINVTGNIRAIYDTVGGTYTFTHIGTHSELYE